MAASLSDQAVLSTDPTFISRVRQSMIATCIAISSEAVSTGYHYARARFVVEVMNNPDSFKGLFAGSVATDASVIDDATQGGTVILTAANIAAQAARVTDAHITNAISGQFNSFFSPFS